MKIKHKHFKQIKVTKISDEEYQKQKEDIILNTKSNFSGLSDKNLVYLKSTNFLPNNYTDLDSNLMNCLKKKENLLKLIDSLIFLKDTMNDQSLIKSSSLIKLAFGDKIEGIESLLGFIQNPHGKKILNNAFFTESQMTQNLFDHLECDFLANLYHVYGLAEVFDYDAIFQVFNGILNESKKDKLVCINILLHVLGGKLKIDAKTKNYKGVFENIFKVMQHFTNGTNKRIDGDILKFFTYVIHCFTVSEFNQIFYENGNLRLFEFEKDFQLKFLNLIFKRYDFKISYIFNNSSKETAKFYELVASYLSDKESLVKNLTVLKTNLTALIFSKGLAKFNINNLEYDYQRDELRTFMENILTISKTIDIKEIKQICYHLIFVFKAFFIKEETLLNDYLLDISKITYLDIEEFEKHLNLLRKVFQFPCYKLNLGVYIKLISNTILTLDNIHSRKFLIDLLTNLFKSNINNYNSEDFYMETLNGIFKMIDDSQYEIKEYIVNNLLTYFINTLDQEINHKVIESLNSQIINKSDTFVYKFINPVSIIFVLGSYLKMFNLEIPKKLQSLIVELKSHNSKIFKNRGAESKLIKTIIADFYNKYKYTFNYARSNMTHECYEAILELSRTKSYFV